jgi:hypothetical protein
VSATTTMSKHFPVRLRPDRTKGDDLRADPLEGCKATPEMILAKAELASDSTRWSATVRPYFAHASVTHAKARAPSDPKP